MIFDAHVHFWDHEARRHAWLDGHPALRRRFGPEDYDPGRHEVGGMIFVQADCRDHEARWAGELMTRDPRVRGIVAYAPVHLGAQAHEHVTALTLLPGVGMRRLLQDEPQSVTWLAGREHARGQDDQPERDHQPLVAQNKPRHPTMTDVLPGQALADERRYM